jgi:hypothetical protein
VSISSQCAAAIENLAVYHFTHAPEGEQTEAGRMLSAHLAKEPTLFQGLLSTLLQIIVFEECANQWSLSRPLLPLILINQDFFNQWQEQVRPRSAAQLARVAPAPPTLARTPGRASTALSRAADPTHAPAPLSLAALPRCACAAQLISQQAATPERQAKLAAAFQKLMAEVQCNLESKNRDKITTNLTLFRHEVKALFDDAQHFGRRSHMW